MGSRIHTFRGLIPAGRDILSPERLQCDNGSITNNWRVTKVELFGNTSDAGFWVDPPNNGDIVFFYLHYKILGNTPPERFADLRNNNQFAWVAVQGVTALERIHSVIDPNHVIVEDLFITVYSIDSVTGSVGTTSGNLQYQITIEEVETSEAQGVLALVKSVGQHGI